MILIYLSGLDSQVLNMQKKMHIMWDYLDICHLIINQVVLSPSLLRHLDCKCRDILAIQHSQTDTPYILHWFLS